MPKIFTADNFVVQGGTSLQFLKADGSVDATNYTHPANHPPSIITQDASNRFVTDTEKGVWNAKQDALTNPITGTGTTNYLPKFTGATTQGNSQIFDNGNIIIGGASFANGHTPAKLNVLGDVWIGDYNSPRILGIEGTIRFRNFDIAQSGIRNIVIDSNNSGIVLQYYNASVLTDGLILRHNGNVLIGTSTDNGAKLQVNGTATFAGSVTAPTFIGALTGNASTVTTNANLTGVVTSVGNATAIADAALSIAKTSGLQTALDAKIGGTGTINYIPKFTGTGTLGNSAIFESGGNVLIGTTTDNGAKLQVNGSILIEGTNDGVTVPSLGSSAPRFKLANGAVYGLVGDVLTNGNSFLQATRVDATAIAYNLLLQPKGGNLLVGTETDDGVNKLQVNGTATFASSVSATSFIKSGGTSAQYLMADGSVSSSTALPYKVYTALMQQSGTAAPTATIMQNTLGATITWSRFGTGQYIGTASSGVLTIGKTTVIVTRPNPSATAFDTNVAGNPINTTTFAYSTFNNTAYLDDQSFSVFVEIRVYP